MTRVVRCSSGIKPLDELGKSSLAKGSAQNQLPVCASELYLSVIVENSLQRTERSRANLTKLCLLLAKNHHTNQLILELDNKKISPTV
jgi:hypothetical protein